MRILLVEDERQIADYLSGGLRAESFAVDHAQNGVEGSYLARTNDYDLIILDKMLPEKSGKQVCEEIRHANIFTPILVLSACAETDEKIILLNSGADDYLIKPFSFEELLARVHALLRRPKTFTSVRCSIDNLVVDTSTREVKRADKQIKLTKKEFALLEYMLRRRDIALSRAMLMEHVWDMSIDPCSNTIDMHIACLRKKIDVPGERKLIHTIPSVGYKLSVNH